MNSGVVKSAHPENEIVVPRTLDETLEVLAADPDVVPIHGGTDLMVDLNFGRVRPATLLDLTRVTDLSQWHCNGSMLRIGAGVTFAELENAPFDTMVPALAVAARTVGSPQIRNRATIGGNLATCSPAGDSWPPLVAALAQVEVASVRGFRSIPLTDFAVGPKKSALAVDELVVAVTVPVACGPQTFLKVGPRNAMVISVTSLALVVDDSAAEIRASFGSAGPVVGQIRLATTDAHRLPDVVADACRPIDDVRSSAEYRRHALRVMARRAMERCLT